MQPFNGSRTCGILKGPMAFWIIFIAAELFGHKCLILLIRLAELLRELSMQNVAETPKVTLFLQGKYSGTFTDPHESAWSPSFRNTCWTKTGGTCWDLPSGRRWSWKLFISGWLSAARLQQHLSQQGLYFALSLWEGWLSLFLGTFSSFSRVL